MSDNENTAAAGSGEVLSAAPQVTLQAKLDKSAATLIGTEDLSPEVAARVTDLLRSGETSPATKSILESVLNFMRETGPNCNISGEDGARKHLSLYRDVQHYINKAPADFRRGLGAVLRIINDQKKNGVFGPRFLFRFVQDMKASPKDIEGLYLLFQALVDLSNPDGRAKTIRQTDLTKIGASALTAEGSQNLVGFFTI